MESEQAQNENLQRLRLWFMDMLRGHTFSKNFNNLKFN